MSANCVTRSKAVGPHSADAVEKVPCSSVGALFARSAKFRLQRNQWLSRAGGAGNSLKKLRNCPFPSFSTVSATRRRSLGKSYDGFPPTPAFPVLRGGPC